MKLFVFLLSLSAIGIIGIIPYSLTQQREILAERHINLYRVLPIQFITNLLVFSAIIGVGLFFCRRTGLKMPIIKGYLNGEDIWARFKKILGPSIVYGWVLGIILLLLDRLIFRLHASAIFGARITPPPWQGLLASFYGGINEEIIARLFCLSLVVWVGCKLFKTRMSWIYWISIIICSVIFGAGHLPTTAIHGELTNVIVIRGISLNGLAGILYGYLFWRQGLESAMIAHFSTDIIVQAIYPVFAT